ncbi:hypothetical protein HZB01_02115 [Candidatus Woesearchaeota archaeon]|nr:hypothetical protein [Candidatus Woesearchaeota archaeon]
MTINEIVERVADGGNLLENLRRIKPGSWQTASRVYAAWNVGVPIEGVYVNLMAGYGKESNDQAIFSLYGPDGNLLADERFQEAAYNGILNDGFFIPSRKMKMHVTSVAPLVMVNYSDLHVKTEGCSETYGFIEALDENTVEEKCVLKAVYGSENPGKGKRVYLLRENVVLEQLKNRDHDDLIVRACDLYNDHIFDADRRYLSSPSCAVRGIRRDVAQGVVRCQELTASN